MMGNTVPIAIIQGFNLRQNWLLQQVNIWISIILSAIGVCSPKRELTLRRGYWTSFISEQYWSNLLLPVFQPLEALFMEQCVDADLDDGVVVSEILSPLSDPAILRGLINPMTSTLSHRELYIQTLDLVQRLCSCSQTPKAWSFVLWLYFFSFCISQEESITTEYQMSVNCKCILKWQTELD